MKSSFRLFCSPRMLIIMLFGFSSGLPLSLTGGTLQAWLFHKKVNLTVIGLSSLIGLPYTLKFLWAPVIDRYYPKFLGRRRSWMLIFQIALVLSISGLAVSDPGEFPKLFVALSVLVAFFSASQDVVVDAYKTEILSTSEYGIGAAIANLGYRGALIFSGAFALILADHMSWREVYLVMATGMSIGIITTLVAPEPEKKIDRPINFRHAVIDPYLEFLRRKQSLRTIFFIIIYKLDVVVAMALMTPFMLTLGFSNTEIGTVSKGFGLAASIFGTFAGGTVMTNLGIRKSLWLFGILQGISGFSFYMLAHLGHSYPMMVTSIIAENFFSGMGTAAYAAFLMSLCNPKFTATQYALLSSLMAIVRMLGGAPTGWLAKTVGWENYFLISIFLAIPGLLILSTLKNKTEFSKSEA